MATKKDDFYAVSNLAQRIFIQLVQSDDLVGEKERRGRDNKEIAEMAFAAASSFLLVKKDYLLKSQKFERDLNVAEKLEAAGFHDEIEGSGYFDGI